MLKWFKYVGVIFVLTVAALVYIGWASDIPRDKLIAKYATGASDFVDLPSGARAHYRMQGNTNGQTLLLLHGSNASLHTWEPWVTQLSDDFFMVTVDLPGHGLTGPVPSDDYSYQGMVKFVKEFTEALDIKNFILGGNSMGGGVTLAYTLQYPDDPTHLILVDAGGTQLPTPPQGEVDYPLAFELAGRWYSSWIIEYITPRNLASEGLFASVSVKDIVTEDMVDRYWELARHPGSRRATGIRFAGYREAGRRDLPVEGIALPTLIIWGDEDKLIPVELGYALDSRIPNSELKVFDGVGHLPMEEVAEESAEAVRAFLGTN